MNNSIFLRRKNKVYVEKGNDELPLNYVGSILKNIESFGYTFSEQLIGQLQTRSLDELTKFYRETVKTLREMVGDGSKYEPMYPNFPQQVMDMTEVRLYVNAIIHYVTNRLPNYEKEERIPLLDNPNLKPIELGSTQEFEKIFTRIASSNTSISATDKEDVKWFIENYRDDVFRLMPEEIPIKENIAYVGNLLVTNTEGSEEFLAKHIKTATDVLRLAVAMSEGDVSLAVAIKFRNLKRFERRVLLGLLEKSGNLIEDMLRWKKRWIRLGERIHPGEYSKTYPNAFKAFDILRNDKPFETFNSKIESALEAKDTAKITEMLGTRAGEYARRLDHLLRLDESKQKETLQTFTKLASDVSTPVLLQVMTHFEHRNDEKDLRIFFPKGEVGKVAAVENDLPVLEKETCWLVAKVCKETLRGRFAELEPLGKCFLDENLKNYLVPFSQRSASKALRTIVRGSHLPLPQAKVIRFFLWWRNGKYRTDIDLSSTLYDEKFGYKDIVSYYNLKSYGGHHSGDIVDAPKGAAEYIDIDIGKTIEMGIRYVVMSLNSYTNQPYCDLPECFAGWMTRTHANSGEIFEPKTVENKIDVASDTKICLPLIADLVDKQIIWTDIALKSDPMWENNVDANLRGVSLMTKAMTELVKTNLHELFSLHIEARGSSVNNIDEAEKVFSVEKGITPFDIDQIASNYM